MLDQKCMATVAHANADEPRPTSLAIRELDSLMPYFAAGRVVTVTPDEARTIAATGDVEIALSKHAGLDVMDIDGALFCALQALASERAPQALGLFTRHWTSGDGGRSRMIGGDHADLLAGDALDSALLAVDALLLECRTHPARIAALLEAADLPHGMDAETAEDDLREVASSPAPATVAEANAAFKAAYPGDHLPAAALHAWLVAFATSMRHACAAGDVVAHVVIF